MVASVAMRLWGSDDNDLTVERLSRRLDEQDARIERLTMEWTEWFDKFRRLYMRIAKRTERDEANNKGADDSDTDRVGAAPVRSSRPRIARGF